MADLMNRPEQMQTISADVDALHAISILYLKKVAPCCYVTHREVISARESYLPPVA